MSAEGTSEPPRVALVGLGNMGLALAARLLDAGLPLQIGNRTPGRAQALIDDGAGVLDAPGLALEQNDICLTSLADDDAVEALVLGPGGILVHARPGTILVEMSTISLTASRRVAERAEEGGVDYVRAPISGNPVAVASGKATIFVSGPAGAINRCEPVLAAITPTVRRLGDGEHARVLKLVLAVLVGGTAELLAESLVLGESAGLDRRTLLEAIGASVVGSTFIGYKIGAAPARRLLGHVHDVDVAEGRRPRPRPRRGDGRRAASGDRTTLPARLGVRGRSRGRGLHGTSAATRGAFGTPAEPDRRGVTRS